MCPQAKKIVLRRAKGKLEFIKVTLVAFEGPGVLQWSEEGEVGMYRHKAKLEAKEGFTLEVDRLKWYRFEPEIRVGDTGMEI